MCGIVGLFDCQSQRDISPEIIHQMNDSQAHRGPDAKGVFQMPGIALGHRRLSIIDVKTGQQPMWSDDQRFCLVFNGEIYNFNPLREELLQQGYPFKTVSDTEVLLAGFKVWGESVVEKLRGMFAFAVFDSQSRSLFLARDRLGIKPLYYAYLPSGVFVFASELKALMRHPHFKLELNPFAVMDYFSYGYVPDPKTIFKDVYKLKPAHALTVKRHCPASEPKAYWDIPEATSEIKNVYDASEAIKAKLSESIDMRLMSEVPLGAFLSGGVDSSVVVANMSQTMKSPVTTCAIGFTEQTFDESRYSQEVAEQFSCRHHEHILHVQQLQSIPNLAAIYDEPFADSSAIPTLKVCEMARRHVTVALSGDGGDELFAGYRRYRGHLLEQRFRQWMPHWSRRLVFGTLASVYPQLKRGPRVLRAKATFEMLKASALEGYFQNISLFKRSWLDSLLSLDFKRSICGYDPLSVLEGYAQQRHGADDLSLIQFLDMKTYLPGDILTKVDRASMLYGLEVRVPMLDHKFVELVQTISPQLKLRHQVGKYILKKAYEDQLSQSILYRKKQGFALPLADWFRGPWRSRLYQLQSSAYFHQTQYFNPKFIAKIIDLHLSHKGDYSTMLWSLCMFEDFIKTHLFEHQEEAENARVACA